MKFFNKAAEDDEGLGVAAQVKNQATPAAGTASRSNNTVIHSAHESTPAAKTKKAYGIQEVIDLMRTLPDVDPEFVMPIVIKTLESARINVDSIIKEATQCEESIENNCVDLISKIETLELQIAKMNDEIMVLNEELDNISSVKNLLLGAMVEEEELVEENDNDDLVAEFNLTEDDITDEMVEKYIDADANFDDIDIDEVLKDVDKMSLAQ